MYTQFITDTKGRKSAVQLPLKYREQIQNDPEEIDRLRNNKLSMTGLAEAVEDRHIFILISGTHSFRSLATYLFTLNFINMKLKP